MYEDLIKRLRAVEKMLTTANFSEASSLISQTVDAIEELLAERDKVNADSWKTAFEVERDEHRWIPVTERLPEEHVFVLIRQDDDRMMVAERVDGDWWYRYFAYDVDRWDENEQGTITHWTPLPEPPKEE